MKFYATSALLKELDRLCRTPSNRSCRKDIYDELKTVRNIKTALLLPTPLAKKPGYSLIKKRVHNSDKNSGKRSGYRLIMCVKEEQEAVYLLMVYPKVGKYGRNTMLKDEINEFLDLLNTEHDKGTLCELTMDENLTIVKNPEKTDRKGLFSWIKKR